MVTDSHCILPRWRNHFSQLLNLLGVKDVRHSEIHTPEPLVPESSVFEFEMDIEEVKRHKSPGVDHILAELIKQSVEHFALRSINFLILSGIRRNCLSSGRSRSLYLFIRGVKKQIIVIIEAYHFCQLHTKCYPTSCCQG